MAQMIVDAVGRAWNNFVDRIADFLPRVVTTVAIVLAGWLIAMLLKILVRGVLRSVRFNAGCDRIGVGAMLKAADLPPADTLAASMVFWLVWIGFLLSGVDVLGFAALEGLVDGFMGFVPRLLVALAIFVAGLVAANFAWRATLLAAVNASVPSARLVASAVRSLILILASAMALEQIAVARTIVLTAFAISFGAVMLGLAISFGIGGGGLARRILERQFPEQARDDDQVSHL